jgi:phosphoserine phosphatase SerB
VAHRFSVREGDPVRFSLAAPYPLPQGLLTHTRTVFASSFGAFQETSPRVTGLNTLSLAVAHAPRAVPESAAAQLREDLRGPAIALNVDNALLCGPIAQSGPRLIVTDVDSTFIQQEVIEMLAAAAGTEEQVRAVTTRAMRGELDFAESLRERVAMLKGISETVFTDVARQIRLTDGAQSLVSTIHAHGGIFGLVSGGFHEVVDTFARPLNVDEILANRLTVHAGHLAGTTYGPIIDKAAKAAALTKWAERYGVPRTLTLAAGDGANDLGMMDAAGFSVAFCAKPIVLGHADAAITTPRLDALLALVGWDAQTPHRTVPTQRYVSQH